MANIHLRIFIIVCLLLGLAPFSIHLFGSQNEILPKYIREKPIVISGIGWSLIFNRPLRVNDIVFFELRVDANIPSDVIMTISNKRYPDAKFLCPLKTSTIRIIGDRAISYRGYFFLPNIIPCGNNIITLSSDKRVIFKNDIYVKREKTFHSPLYIKGWPDLAYQSETGMTDLKPTAYKVSAVAFKNPNNEFWLFLKAKAFDHSIELCKLNISTESGKTDAITLNRQGKPSIIYFPAVGSSDTKWLRFNFEVSCPSTINLRNKDNVVIFDYIVLLPKDIVPIWINNFYKK